MAVEDIINANRERVLFEDERFVIILAGKCTAGHIQIYPKNNISKLEQLENEEAEDIFFLASFAASALFELLGAQGTNIIINESDQHLCLNVIARKQEDGLDFHWAPKKLDQNVMSQVESSIQENMMIGEPEEEEQPIEIEQKIDKVEDKEKENYLIKQLLRIP